MKKSVILGLVLILVVVSATGAFASFNKGEKYLGVSIGLNYFDSTPIFGANFEVALNNNWGLGVLARYWSWSGFSTYSYYYTYFGVQGNYHFKFGGPKLDLYLGLALGYGVFGSSYSSAVGASTLFLSGHAGARYKLSDSLFLTGRLIYGGFGGVEAGIDFKF